MIINITEIATKMSSDDKKKWTTCFNSKFDEFITDLKTLYPDDKDFKILKNSFNLLKIASENKPLELFIKYGTSFEQHVKTKNENFFLEHDYDNVISQESNFTDDLIKKLKSYWKDMNDQNKDIIWKYLTLFFTIKNKVVS